MFSEILKIVPKIESGDLSKMESSLNGRFMRISKKFGKGLLAVLTGGGVAGVALGFLDKLLNPLKDTQDAIDKVLHQGNDIVTNAEHFGTTAGKLFKLQLLAKSKGLDEGALSVLMEKFQVSIAEAVADPTKQTSVRHFVPKYQRDAEGQIVTDSNGKAKFEKQDTAEAFFAFIQALKALPKEQQILAQQEVFGEKQILKAAEFLQSNFAEQMLRIKVAPSETYTPGIEHLSRLNDVKQNLEAQRAGQDMLRKSDIINADFILAQAKREQKDLDKENRNIEAYKALSNIQELSSKLVGLFEKSYLEIAKVAATTETMEQLIQAIPNKSRIMRGILTGGKGD